MSAYNVLVRLSVVCTSKSLVANSNNVCKVILVGRSTRNFDKFVMVVSSATLTNIKLFTKHFINILQLCNLFTTAVHLQYEQINFRPELSLPE